MKETKNEKKHLSLIYIQEKRESLCLVFFCDVHPSLWKESRVHEEGGDGRRRLERETMKRETEK
jgi:hypothetical protein